MNSRGPTTPLLYESRPVFCHSAPFPQQPLTSSKMRFLALVIAELRALIHDSFSSGLTARKIRLGAWEETFLL